MFDVLTSPKYMIIVAVIGWVLAGVAENPYLISFNALMTGYWLALLIQED